MFYHVSHNSRSNVCLFATCFHVFVQQKKTRTQNDDRCVGVPSLVVMVCVSMHCLTCFDLCALHCCDVFVFVTAILIQRSQYSQDDRVVVPSSTNTTRVQRSNVSLSAFSMDGLAVPLSKWKHVSLQRAILACRIRACRARVEEKGATRSIATGTANVKVGSSQTDMVAEKIESETCRPSTLAFSRSLPQTIHTPNAPAAYKTGATFVTVLSELSVQLCLEDSYLLCVVSPPLHVDAEASLCRFGDLRASKSLTS